MRITRKAWAVCALALGFLCGVSTGQTPDCLEIESIIDASDVPIPWTRGACCDFFTPLDVPATFRGFNCSASGRVTRASLALMNLKGPLPSLTNFTELELLDVTANNLTGPFPSLRGLTKLKFLYARGNNFTTFPPEIPDLVALQNVQLYNNSISGPLPNLTNISQLFVFWVDGNNLTGPVDNLLPPSLRFCRLTFGDTNPGLFTATDQVPPACLSEGQVIPNVNKPRSTASSDSKTVKPPNWQGVIAAIVAGTVVLVAASAFFIWRSRKRRKEREVKELKEPHWFFLRTAGPLGLENADSVEYSGPPFSVVQSYEKQAPDEMDLTPGTTVQMQSIFRDGWAACWDESGTKFGTVPLDCLLLTDHILAPHDARSFPLLPGEGSLVHGTGGSASWRVGGHSSIMRSNGGASNTFSTSGVGSVGGGGGADGRTSTPSSPGSTAIASPRDTSGSLARIPNPPAAAMSRPLSGSTSRTAWSSHSHVGSKSSLPDGGGHAVALDEMNNAPAAGVPRSF